MSPGSGASECSAQHTLLAPPGLAPGGGVSGQGIDGTVTGAVSDTLAVISTGLYAPADNRGAREAFRG